MYKKKCIETKPSTDIHMLYYIFYVNVYYISYDYESVISKHVRA